MVCRGNKPPNDVVDWEDGFVELFAFSVFVHSAQDVRDDDRLSWDVVNVKVEFLESVQPSDLAR